MGRWDKDEQDEPLHGSATPRPATPHRNDDDDERLRRIEEPAMAEEEDEDEDREEATGAGDNPPLDD